jgi:hypothetical protein
MGLFNVKLPDADWMQIGLDLLSQIKAQVKGRLTYECSVGGERLLVVVAKGDDDIQALKHQLAKEC